MTFDLNLRIKRAISRVHSSIDKQANALRAEIHIQAMRAQVALVYRFKWQARSIGQQRRYSRREVL